MNMGVQISVRVSAFSSFEYPEVELLNHMVTLCLDVMIITLILFTGSLIFSSEFEKSSSLLNSLDTSRPVHFIFKSSYTH